MNRHAPRPRLLCNARCRHSRPWGVGPIWLAPWRRSGPSANELESFAWSFKGQHDLHGKGGRVVMPMRITAAAGRLTEGEAEHAHKRSSGAWMGPSPSKNCRSFQLQVEASPQELKGL